MKITFGLLLVAAMILFWPGCREYDRVQSKEAMELIRATYTACSSKSLPRIQKVERELTQLGDKIQSSERESISEILQIAKTGDWEQARNKAYRMAEDQVR